MTVSMTEAAAKHVSQFLEKRGKGIGLRVGVKTSGCSGMAYKSSSLTFSNRMIRCSIPTASR